MRLRMRVARPMARGRKRLSVGPSSAVTDGDAQVVADQLVVVLGVGDRGLEQLAPVARDGARACRRGSRGPRRRPCRGCGRRRGAPCARTCGRTWRARGRPARASPGLRCDRSSAPASPRRRASPRPSSARRAALGASASPRRGASSASAARRSRPRPRRSASAVSAFAFGGGLLARLGLRLRPRPSARRPPPRRSPRPRSCVLGLLRARQPSASGPSRSRRGRGTGASARTRRACGRPSTRVTNTGTCLRPSWTAIVCPTISGKIVEARDQVLTIGLLFGGVHGLDARHQALLDPRALLARADSLALALPTPAAADDVAVGRLVLLARAVAERRHAPRA